MNKHYFGYGIALLIVLFIGVAWLRSHDARLRMEGDIRVHEEQAKHNAATVKTNDIVVAGAQKTVVAAEQSNVVIDQKTKLQLAGLQAQLNSKPDADQIRSIVQAALPGVQTIAAKDAAGNAVLAVADTQQNRDAINSKDVEFKTCQFKLSDCEQKQANFLSIIAAKDTQLTAQAGSVAALKDTIGAQNLTIKEQSRFGKGGNIWSRTGRVLLPILCAGAGAGLGATQGTKGAAIGALTAGGTCAFAFHF
ncbi:MAG TPA: hypothetical protein VGP89_17940 [Candidatus Angelobacter sp.]|nr:hypothetical protein [Candidatus Angelobacter sp.]